MAKSEMEALCEEWLAERMNPEDKEGLAAFQRWMERRAKDPSSCGVTVQEAVSMWERMKAQRKFH
jgi:hypothetical protein